MIIPVILSGGSGTRLWPLSRELYPKQHLALTSDQTMLQETVSRLDDLPDSSEPVVICNEEHRFLVAEQFRQLDKKTSSIILEPEGRNTAPAVALACLQALDAHQGDPPLLLILPADHTIQDNGAFIKGIKAGVESARSGKLVTFGILPKGPETGYGYIKQGKKIKLRSNPDKDASALSIYTIDSFVEKPDIKTAKNYIEAGDYMWNSGIFLFRADIFLKELIQFNPSIAKSCQSAFDTAQTDLDFLRVNKQAFCNSPSDSIDCAVMEKTRLGVMIPINPGWNDVGSWSALWEVCPQDGDGNVIRGDIQTKDTSNSYIQAENRMVATIGIEDQIVVETSDVVLVAAKDKVQDVKAIVSRLKSMKRQEVNLHRRVYRPWGSYEGVSTGDRFQVKLIIVNPGSILSLQKHHHRSEHWIVVNGSAKVTKGDEEFLLWENESTFIPMGVVHRLENPGKIPLEIIEVQSGSYLGEDDITRFEDNYGRVQPKNS